MRADEAPIEAPDGSDSFDLIVLGTGLVEALVAGCALFCDWFAALLARCGALRARYWGVCAGRGVRGAGGAVRGARSVAALRLRRSHVCAQRCGQGWQERAARGPRGALRRPGAPLPAGRAPPARSRASRSGLPLACPRCAAGSPTATQQWQPPTQTTQRSRRARRTRRPCAPQPPRDAASALFPSPAQTQRRTRRLPPRAGAAWTSRAPRRGIYAFSER